MRTLMTVAVLAALLAPVRASAEPPAVCGGLAVTILGTDGADDLDGTEGPDVVSLGDGNDQFRGHGGDDVVCGGAGLDTIYGHGGDDVLDGGAGDDSLWDDNPGGPAAGVDGADVLVGGDGDDDLWLIAGDGVGGAGADTADGGAGTDSLGYLASPVGVAIDVAAGLATGGDSFTAVEGPFTGSGHDDLLQGTSDDDVLLAGRPGPDGDRVYGGDGDDVVAADAGTVDAGSGDDEYRSENESHDRLEVWLGDGADVAVLDDGGPVRLRGGPGEDLVVVREPHDSDGLRGRLQGGPDDDELTFAALPRPVRVDLAERTASYGRSRLLVKFFDVVTGTAYDDVLAGAEEADRLVGGAGDDVLRGRRGPDVLVGNRGRDRAYGGRGRDWCLAEVQVDCQ